MIYHIYIIRYIIYRYIDLYTCFPISSQAAAREFGLASVDDGTKMTLTGGLDDSQ